MRVRRRISPSNISNLESTIRNPLCDSGIETAREPGSRSGRNRSNRVRRLKIKGASNITNSGKRERKIGWQGFEYTLRLAPARGAALGCLLIRSTPRFRKRMRVCILGSGSSGNATLIVAGETRVLVDCGLSAREIVQRMQAVGEDASRLDAVVVSHEHGDHIRGLPPLSKAFGVPVYISAAAFDACNFGPRAGQIRRGEALAAARDFEIGPLRIHPFAIPHDAADPLAFTIECGGVKMGIALDLGHISPEVAESFRGSDLLVLEANYEIEMLRLCEYYPWALKQRIMGRNGHTSNDEMARYLREDFDGRAAHIVLAHLSRNTNHPEIARLAAIQALETRAPLFSAQAGSRVNVARYDAPTDWIEL
jgi:phosphoribosyl 1,2-cyclic phosphodiesterase